MRYFSLYLCFSLFQCLLLSALYQLPQIRADYPSDGVSLEYCREKEDCAGSRKCYTVGEEYLQTCNATATDCFCRYSTSEICSSSADCSDGERCFGFQDSDSSDSGTFCGTCRLQLSESFPHVDENPDTCKGVWLGGYTGDICRVGYSECVGDGTCQEFLEGGSTDWCSFGTSPCFCWPDSLKSCTSSQDCQDGERCAEDGEGVTACFSCGRVEADDTFSVLDENKICSTPSPNTATNSPSPSSSMTASGNNDSNPSSGAPLVSAVPPPPPLQPCIAVFHLLRVEKRDLIFPDHIRAVVLCDHRDSCSTPGHMVVYNNIPMSMHSYCTKYSSCFKRIAMVNNPKIRKAFRIPSNTEGLHFTVFSARYGTKLEESLLRLAISFGM